MKKGQRPSKHVRRVKTNKGRKKIVVNPNIRKSSVRKRSRRKSKKDDEETYKPAKQEAAGTSIASALRGLLPKQKPIPKSSKFEKGRESVDVDSPEDLQDILTEQERIRLEAEYGDILDELLAAQEEEEQARMLESYEREILRNMKEEERLAQEEKEAREKTGRYAKDRSKLIARIAKRIEEAPTQKEKYAIYKDAIERGEGKGLFFFAEEGKNFARAGERAELAQKINEDLARIEAQVEPTLTKVDRARQTREWNKLQEELMERYKKGDMSPTEAALFKAGLKGLDGVLVQPRKAGVSEDPRDVAGVQSIIQYLVDTGRITKDEAKTIRYDRSGELIIGDTRINLRDVVSGEQKAAMNLKSDEELAADKEKAEAIQEKAKGKAKRQIIAAKAEQQLVGTSADRSKRRGLLKQKIEETVDSTSKKDIAKMRKEAAERLANTRARTEERKKALKELRKQTKKSREERMRKIRGE